MYFPKIGEIAPQLENPELLWKTNYKQDSIQTGLAKNKIKAIKKAIAYVITA